MISFHFNIRTLRDKDGADNDRILYFFDILVSKMCEVVYDALMNVRLLYVAYFRSISIETLVMLADCLCRKKVLFASILRLLDNQVLIPLDFLL